METSVKNNAIETRGKWALLFKIAGYSTVIMLVIIPVQIFIFSTTPMPSSIDEWFSLFHTDPILGLIHLDMLYIINNIIVAIMYLAFYLSLKNKNESIMAIAILLGFLGISAYFASNKCFEFLELSFAFYSAENDAQRNMLLAAGQGLLTQWRGTAFLIYYILNGFALILLSSVILKSSVFSRATGGFGLAAGILMLIPSTVGTVGLFFSLASLLPWYVFSILAAKRFLQLGSRTF